MKFVLSFSGGEDSVLALDRLVRDGHTPLALFIMYNQEAGRSWFHEIDEPLLNKISESLLLPLWIYPTSGEEYHLAMQKALERAKAEGADAVAFGDIDVKENCEPRKKLVCEVVERGYACIIKCVRNSDLSQNFLGKVMTREIVEEMEKLGVDASGEGGEFHTVAVNGPLFAFPVEIENKGILNLGNISVADIVLKQ